MPNLEKKMRGGLFFNFYTLNTLSILELRAFNLLKAPKFFWPISGHLLPGTFNISCLKDMLK